MDKLRQWSVSVELIVHVLAHSEEEACEIADKYEHLEYFADGREISAIQVSKDVDRTLAKDPEGKIIEIDHSDEENVSRYSPAVR